MFYTDYTPLLAGPKYTHWHLLLIGLCCALGCPRLSAETPGTARASSNANPQFRMPKAGRPGQMLKKDAAEVALGERLFLETRFAQYFFEHCHGNVNAVLTTGDPVLTKSESIDQPLPGPFAGFSINCRSCHLVREQFALGRGARAYADFARRSPIPARGDGKKVTARNSPAMVNTSINREGEKFFHYDAEFGTGSDLVKATLTGRNFGWLTAERNQAVRHISRVIREDDGRGTLAREFGGYSYGTVFAGTDSKLDEDSVLPEEYRIDVAKATDLQVLAAVAKALEAYMDSLYFSRDETVQYDGSPYDSFLKKNDLPRKEDDGQSLLYYSRNLLSLATRLREPRFVSPADNCFKLIKQDFRFGARELEGLKIFFGRPAASKEMRRSGIGNCVACHAPPNFTDFAFHNTGASQEEYDTVHGAGAFAKLPIPGLKERNSSFERYLPGTVNHPNASGRFLDIPTADRVGHVDLGVWNVFENPEQPLVQSALRRTLDPDGKFNPGEILERSIAAFKTPGLRGLAMSHPYLHNGSKDKIEDVIRFYIKISRLARAGELRNGDPELAKIFLTEEDIDPLAAFLRSLNEDYE